MEKEPRKASDVLLDLEKKLDVALSIIRTQDLNIKILSNKLNSILDALEKRSVAPPKIVSEAVQAARPTIQPVLPTPSVVSINEIPVSAELNLPLEESPQGFRRTSRPETFAGDDTYLRQASKLPTQSPKMPVAPKQGINTPPPGRSMGEVVVPAQATKKTESPTPRPQQAPTQAMLQNAIPVSQRVVNGHGKSLFLADVEVIDASNMQTVLKTRTNGTGKWQASLGVGGYRVIIRKLDSASKERLEVTQDISVDGSQSPFELQTIIVKA